MEPIHEILTKESPRKRKLERQKTMRKQKKRNKKKKKDKDISQKQSKTIEKTKKNKKTKDLGETSFDWGLAWPAAILSQVFGFFCFFWFSQWF